MADETNDHIHDAVVPLVELAIRARLTGDFLAAATALDKATHLGEIECCAAFGALTAAALPAVPAGLVPGQTWVPQFAAGNPPQPVDPEGPVAKFVLGYLAAFQREDAPGAGALWRAFAYKPAELPAKEQRAARMDVTVAFALMLSLAARGAKATMAPRGGRNARPGARSRTGRRPRHQHRR